MATNQTSDDGHAHGETEPVTDHTHDNSWSANLEKPQYEGDLTLLKRHAIDAIEQTTSGYHVNLVTHGTHGHPESYLYEDLSDRFNDDDIHWEYIEQCGCGGHVLRVYVE